MAGWTDILKRADEVKTILGIAEPEPKTTNLEALAVAKIPELEAMFPRLLSKFKTALRKDVASYTFDCRRYGDFMTLEITRGKAFATTINLAQVRSLTLVDGHEPDKLGTITFTAYLRNSTDSYALYGGMPADTMKANTQDGYEWVINPQVPSLSEPSIFALHPDSPGNAGGIQYVGHYANNTMLTKVQNAPRPAQDDTIRLEGLRATLYVPHGLGSQVRDKILAAMASKK